MNEKQRKLAADNMRLVAYTMGRYGMSGDDAYSDGCLALCLAARRYDEERGGSFANYAITAIERMLWRGQKQEQAGAWYYTPAAIEDGYERVERRESARVYMKWLDERLSGRDRAMMRDWLSGMSYRELGAAYGLTHSRCHKIVTRILGEIRREFDVSVDSAGV